MNPRISKQPRMAFIIVQTLTLARIPLAIVFAIVVHGAKESGSILVLCVILLILNELTDCFDGILARRFGLATEWGAILDPYSDSISRLIVYWAQGHVGLVIPHVFLVMACRDLTVAYCRIVLTRSGRSAAAKWSGKVKAVFQGVGAILAVLGPVYWRFTGTWTIQALSWMVIGITLASIIEYATDAVSTIWVKAKRR